MPKVEQPTEEQIKEAILHEICLCCVHKPLEIHEGLFRDSPQTYIGTGCWKNLEGSNYCGLAHKALRAIWEVLNETAK